MFFPIDVVNLILYFVQQLGVMCGVGAATVLLITYLVSGRDGVFDARETQFGISVHKVMVFGLTLIVASGLVITIVHLSTGASAVVFAPAFLFKWMLIVLLVVGETLRGKHLFSRHVAWQGLLGAHWYALFVVHVLAPVALWLDLIVLYAIWVSGFVLSFVSLERALRANGLLPTVHLPHVHMPQLHMPAKKPHKPLPNIKKLAPVAAATPRIVPRPHPPPPLPKPLPPPPPVPKPLPPPPLKLPMGASTGPVVFVPQLPIKPAVIIPPLPHKPLPPLPHKPMLVPHIAPKPAPVPLPKKPPQAPLKTFSGDVPPQEELPGLPAIRVMPKSQEDADKFRKLASAPILPIKTAGQTPPQVVQFS